jgi:hypothetical protein
MYSTVFMLTNINNSNTIRRQKRKRNVYNTRYSQAVKFLGNLVWKITILRQKILFFQIAEVGPKIIWAFRVKNHDLRQKIIFFPILGRGARRVRPSPPGSAHDLDGWRIAEKRYSYGLPKVVFRTPYLNIISDTDHQNIQFRMIFFLNKIKCILQSSC